MYKRQLLRLVFDRLAEAVDAHVAKLKAQFEQFDTGEKGLDFREFGAMLDACCNGADAMTPKDKMRVFERIESKEGGDDDDDSIEDPTAFAAGIVRSMCPLAFPRCCRNYWRE